MNKWKTIFAALTAAILVSGAAAQPAQQDLPDPGMTPANPFYFLEQASESMALAVAKSPLGSPELESKVRANQASERLAEARKLAEQNRTEQVERAMERYRNEMNRSIAIASRSEDEDLRRRLGNATSNQEKVLEEVKQRVPEEAQKGIETAIENNRQGRERLENPGRGQNANRITPGNPEKGRPETRDQEDNSPPDIPEPGEPPLNNSTVEKPVEDLPSPELSENDSSNSGPITGGAVEDVPGRNTEQENSAGSNVDEKQDRKLPDIR